MAVELEKNESLVEGGGDGSDAFHGSFRSQSRRIDIRPFILEFTGAWSIEYETKFDIIIEIFSYLPVIVYITD
jgi:hypothetical protein